MIKAIDLEWIIDEVHPLDYEAYFGEPAGRNNRASWTRIKEVILLEKDKEFKVIFDKVANHDFSGYDNSDPIRIVTMHDWNYLTNGHHRVIAAWMQGKQFVQGIVE